MSVWAQAEFKSSERLDLAAFELRNLDRNRGRLFYLSRHTANLAAGFYVEQIPGEEPFRVSAEYVERALDDGWTPAYGSPAGAEGVQFWRDALQHSRSRNGAEL